MPYSVDGKDNQENPYSPNPYTSIEGHVMAKLASLDATLAAGFRRLDDNVNRLRDDMQQSNKAVNDRINALDKEFTDAIAFKRARIDQLVKEGMELEHLYNKRLVDIETWQKVVVAKMTIVGAAIVGLWTFVAPSLRTLLGISNG